MEWVPVVSISVGAIASLTSLGVAYLTHKLVQRRDLEARAVAKREKEREQNRAIVDVLSLWTRSHYVEATNEDRWRLQSEYWRLVLGLDIRLLNLLLPRLANASDALQINEILVHARALTMELDQPDLKAEQLNTWIALTKEPTEVSRSTTS